MLRSRSAIPRFRIVFSTSRRCMSFHTARVIRVDIAMSALSSAIHNTGHYHGRPRPVCLPPSCIRSANNGHRRCSSGVLTLVDLANMTHVRPPKNWHTGCCESARELLPGRFAWFLSDRNLAKDSAGLAGRRPPTERWQDKRREVRSGRTGEEGKSISSLQRGAFLAFSL